MVIGLRTEVMVVVNKERAVRTAGRHMGRSDISDQPRASYLCETWTACFSFGDWDDYGKAPDYGSYALLVMQA